MHRRRASHISIYAVLFDLYFVTLDIDAWVVLCHLQVIIYKSAWSYGLYHMNMYSKMYWQGTIQDTGGSMHFPRFTL